MKSKPMWDWLQPGDEDVREFFGDVSPSVLKKVVPDMVRTFGAGDVLMREGEAPEALTVLLRGEVAILRGGVEIASRTAPTLLGEQALVEDHVHSAQVTVRRLARGIVLPRPLAEELLDDAAFSRAVAILLSRKLRDATHDREWHYAVEKRLFGEFKAHTSRAIGDRLLQSGENYGAPRTIQAAILFSDIRGFTSLSAQLSPEQLAAELGLYLDAVVEVIHGHGGLVDKFIGDAVMAVWGYAPEVEGPLDAARVLQCARDMVATAARFQINGQPIQIGVGLNVGQVFSGNIGSNGKRQWTVLGDPVNMASRFESASKGLGAPIVLGRSFVDLLDASPVPLTAHHDQAFKNAPNQTVYTLDPQ